MGKYKLALFGCGYLNQIVGKAYKDGMLEDFELIAVLDSHAERANAYAKEFGGKACTDINDLLAMKPDFISEATSVASLTANAEQILISGASLVVLSIGALADEAFYERVKVAARKGGSRMYIASGAVGGFDVLRAAALMSPIEASISSLKTPASLYHSPLYEEGLLDIKEPKRVFTGTTKEAIKLLPTHMNVAVATALASAGPGNTKMNIDAVPGFQGDQYKIEVRGQEVAAELHIYSRTCNIAAWSVVSTLQNAVAPIVF